MSKQNYRLRLLNSNTNSYNTSHLDDIKLMANESNVNFKVPHLEEDSTNKLYDAQLTRKAIAMGILNMAMPTHKNHKENGDEVSSGRKTKLKDYATKMQSIQNEKYFIEIRANLRKLARKRNNIKILEYHMKHGSAPTQLDFDKFPVPFLKHDSSFVSKYNSIIKRCQHDIMDCIIEHLRKQNEEIYENVLVTKMALNEVPGAKESIKKIEDEINESLKDSFEKAMSKAHEINSNVVERADTRRPNNTPNSMHSLDDMLLLNEQQVTNELKSKQKIVESSQSIKLTKLNNLKAQFPSSKLAKINSNAIHNNSINQKNVIVKETKQNPQLEYHFIRNDPILPFLKQTTITNSNTNDINKINAFVLSNKPSMNSGEKLSPSYGMNRKYNNVLPPLPSFHHQRNDVKKPFTSSTQQNFIKQLYTT